MNVVVVDENTMSLDDEQHHHIVMLMADVADAAAVVADSVDIKQHTALGVDLARISLIAKEAIQQHHH